MKDAVPNKFGTLFVTSKPTRECTAMNQDRLGDELEKRAIAGREILQKCSEEQKREFLEMIKEYPIIEERNKSVKA
ncbi:MAG: hypothetical protein WD605_00220 [Candidatus Paceibacterota bacterium]